MANDLFLASLNLFYDPKGPALVCTTCKCALAVSGFQITSHLWNKHQICIESRRAITPLIRSLQIPSPTDISPRPDQSLRHPHLTVYRGYACVTCNSRTINLDTMTRHVLSCRPSIHRPSRRRRNPDNLYEDVLLQSWGSGPSRRYWIVQPVVQDTGRDT